MTNRNNITQIGTDWLGIIPKEWGVTKLWELYTYKKERSDQEEELLSVYRDHGVIPKSSRDDNHNKASEDLSNYLLIRPDDLVINKMKAWQGSIALSAYRGIVSPAYFTYKLTNTGRKKLHLKYIHHLLRSRMYIETYKRISKGIRPGQWDLDPYQFKILPVLVPSIEIQKNIADFLDKKTRVIDELVTKKVKLIKLLLEKRAAIITSAVTKGLDPKAKMKSSGIDWLGDIPERWNLVKNRSVLFFKGNRKNSDPNATVLSLSINGVKIKTDLNFGKSTDNYIGHQLVFPGDLVFTPRDFDQTPILSGVAKDHGCISNLYFVLGVKNGTINEFVNYYWWGIKYGADYFYNFSNGMRFSYNRQQFNNIPFLEVPEDEQIAIVKFLKEKDKEFIKFISIIELQIKQLKEYRSSLIYSAVTGKIKV